MSATGAILKRELGNYFSTPVADVFIVIFLVLAGVFTFYLGGLYERGQADLQPFTRSLSGVQIPDGIKQVVVRGHDSVHGYGGKEKRVNLAAADK